MQGDDEGRVAAASSSLWIRRHRDSGHIVMVMFQW